MCGNSCVTKCVHNRASKEAETELDREMAYRHALEVLREGLRDATNTNLVDYIDAVLTPNA